MNILVTGGNGVIGTSLVKRLKMMGHQVWVCDLQHSHQSQYFRCDVSKYRQLLEVFSTERYDLVYHLAAEYGRWNGEGFFEDVWMTNCVGTKNMLNMQEKLGFKMVFTSSSEIYGDLPEVMRETVTDEQAIKQMNDYAISKAANELQILNAQAMFNSPTVTVRLFNVYGPGEYYTPYRSAIAIFIYRALHNLPYTVYTSHRRSSLYIDDCTACLARIAHNFKSGEVYNIAHGETHYMKDVSDLILDYLGKNDDQVEYLTEERRTTGTKKPDISKAKRDLDFYPQVHLEEGIAKTIEWMRHVYSG